MSPALFFVYLLAAPCKETLPGTTVDAATGEALPRVTLRLGNAVAQSDGEGHFVLKGLCRGQNLLRASRLDYASSKQQVHIESDNTAEQVALLPVRINALDDLVVERPRLNVFLAHSVDTLGKSELEATRGKSLADTLALLPGLRILRSGAVAKPILRGMSGARVLVLYDGIRLESQDWGLDHGPEIDPLSAAEIEVVRGASAVRFGPDAMAGAILLKPAPLRTEPGTEAHALSAGAWNGRKGTIGLRVDHVPEWQKSLRLRLRGSASKGRALQAPDYALANTGVEEWNAGGTLAYAGAHRQLKLSIQRSNSKNGICNCLRASSPSELEAQFQSESPIGADRWTANYLIERPFQKVTHTLALARWEEELKNFGTLTCTYGFQNNARQEFDTVRSSVEGPQFDFSLRTHTLDTNYEHPPIGIRTAQLSGRIGFSGMQQNNVYQGLTLIPNYAFWQAGVFLEEQLAVESWQFVAGARLDVSKRDVFLDSQLARRHRAQGGLTGCARNGDVTSCSDTYRVYALNLGAVRKLSKWATARLEFSSAARMPTIDEQYIQGTAPSFPVLAIGDPNLNPERSHGASATVEAKLGHIRAKGSGFFQRTSDYINFAPARNADGTPVIDVIIRGAFPRYEYAPTTANLYGGEADITWTLNTFSVQLQGAWVRGKDSQNDDFLPRIPSDRYNAILRYAPKSADPAFTQQVSLRGEWITRQTRWSPDTDVVPPPRAYGLAHADWSSQFTLFAQEWTALTRNSKHPQPTVP